MLIWGIAMVRVVPPLLFLLSSQLLSTDIARRHHKLCWSRGYVHCQFLLVGLSIDLDPGLRFLLGLAEAGLYPGVVFYMSW